MEHQLGEINIMHVSIFQKMQCWCAIELCFNLFGGKMVFLDMNTRKLFRNLSLNLSIIKGVYTKPTHQISSYT